MRRTYEEMKYFKMELQNREVNFNSKFGAQPRVGTLNPLASQKAAPNGGNGTGRRGAEKMGPASMGAASMGACGLGGGVGGGVDARVQMPTGGAVGGGAVGGGAVGGGAVGGGAGPPGPPMGRRSRQPRPEHGAAQISTSAPTVEGGEPGELDIGSRGGSGGSAASGQSIGEGRAGGGLGRRRAASSEWDAPPERPPPGEPKRSSRERRPIASGL